MKRDGGQRKERVSKNQRQTDGELKRMTEREKREKKQGAAQEIASESEGIKEKGLGTRRGILKALK